MAQSQQTETQVFASGINTRIAPHLMQQAESVELSNVDIRSGSLKSKRLHTEEELDTLSMFYWFKGQYIYYESFRSNVLWNGVYYYSDAFSVMKTIDGITQLPVGVNAPVSAPTLTLGTPTGEGLKGQYTYVYTYVDEATGVESPPSPPAVSIFANLNSIQVTGLLPEPSLLDYSIRLYRVGEGITVFSSVTTLSSSTVSYTDELHFTEIEANLLTTTRAFPPTQSMINLTESRGRFYGSTGTFLNWSAVGKPDSWYALDSMSFPEEITMVSAVANGLLVATERQTWLVTGDTPSRFRRHLLSASEGCISNQSLAVYNGMAIWLSDNGIVSSDGSSVNSITMGKLDRLTGIDPLSATIHNNTYYLGYTEQMYPSDTLLPDDTLYPTTVESNQEFPTGIYIVDFSFGDPRILFSYQEEIGYMDTAGAFLDQIIPVNNEGVITNNRLHMFNGDFLQDIVYVSPLHTEGSIGFEKQYEKARIVFQGSFTVILRDHNGAVMAQQDIQSDFLVSEWVGVSPSNNRGFGIQYDIRGSGVIVSLSHVWTPREAQ